jgi:hypothetical protein
MEWKLDDKNKEVYRNLLDSARDIESNIGSISFRVYKLMNMREDIDRALKDWWDKIIKEMNLDAGRDYMITKDGDIKDVSKHEPPAKPAFTESSIGTNAAELK